LAVKLDKQPFIPFIQPFPDRNHQSRIIHMAKVSEEGAPLSEYMTQIT
jgi:hypothetical protein